MKNNLTLSEFILKQATNAGVFLGQRENPLTGEKSINLIAAEGSIGVLQMLHDKTKGNLDPAEQKLLTDTLTTLENLYEQVTEI